MAKSKLRLKARELRKSGLGIKTIAHSLKVSSSTVSLWCRDIELSSEQLMVLQKNARSPYYGKRGEYLKNLKLQQEYKVKLLVQEGINDVGRLSKRELFIAGIALYWAEGFKKDNLIGFSNSDPEMIRFMIHWLENAVGIKSDRLRFRLALNDSYKKQSISIQKYWQDLLGVKEEQFQKTFFQKVKWQKIYDNPQDYHGVLRIRVSKSVDILRRVLGQIEGMRSNS